MIIVGLQNCDMCHVYKDLHPEYEFVEIPINEKKSTDLVRGIKKALFRLGHDGKFPVLMDDHFKELTPMETLRKELEEKTSSG